MMRIDLFTLCGVAAICSACSPSPNESTGTGATGGSDGGTGGATTTTMGGAGGTGGTGTGGAAGCEAPAEYDNTTETGLPACNHPVAPLPMEDGTFAVTVFGPFATPFQLDGFTFAATEGTDSSITDPWTAAVIVVPGATSTATGGSRSYRRRASERHRSRRRQHARPAACGGRRAVQDAGCGH
jgi:hypothetical protein